MRVFYIFLNICLPYYNSVISTYTWTNGSTSTSDSAILISSPVNSVCNFISIAYVAKITSTFFCSWIVYGSCSSWPLL
jgi:hypothetical protein